MKILGGKYKGRNFYMPAHISPTQDVFRKAIFDILGHDLEGLTFLDLFAGSGAVGMEAISRGAKLVVMVEHDPKCADVIEQNLNMLKIGYPYTDHVIMNADAMATVKQMGRDGKKFDIVFLDPPYGLGLAKKILKLLMAYDILHPHSYVVAQYEEQENLPDLEGRFCVVKSKSFGRSCLTILEKNNEVEKSDSA